MNWFNSLSVQVKILTIPVVGALGFSVYLLISILSMSNTVDLLKQAYQIDYRLLQTAELGLVKLDKIKETLANAATMGEGELIDNAKVYSQEIEHAFTTTALADKENAIFLNAWLRDFKQYYVASSTLSAQMVDGTINFDTLASQAQRISEQLIKIESNLATFKHQRYEAFVFAFEEVNTNVESTSQTGLIIGIATIGLLFIVAVPIARNTKRSLAEIIDSMRNIAQDDADLTVRLKTNSKDEIGELVFWFNTFIEKLQGVIKRVVDTSLPIANTAENIQRLSNDTIISFTKQSESVIQSRQSVDEMSQSVGEITRNAADAATAAQNANKEADLGREVVLQTVAGIEELAQIVADTSDTINQLQEDTNRVNVVLEVIKGIAEQTNLLALNAAIEAARAGEQGRGFAVVADEVRNLASRTQESTEEINLMLIQLQTAASKAVSMMDNSRQSVEASVNSANQAGERLMLITETVNTISDMNGAIAVATEEQSQVATIMVGQVEDIQLCAQEASAASNEIANVTNDLNMLASELAKITGQFKV
ncbi:MAG: methyl-accepting chemotaxis protein [Gammaproteobacteria bacterium]|nr:methyl-accepting chemotaxis protein [Gammaproteobacteria bacterium]